ncbi:MAG: hypothetical protein J6X88_05080 [Bacteroidales bacterium]|nr:hypothetical protein [Bacteroidales bacterium]
MKQASLIAAVSMAVLVLVDILNLLSGRWFGVGILYLILNLAAKCGLGYFFITLYKKQG